MTFRILHVDDDSDIREVVALSLNLDPEFDVTSCVNGHDALSEASDQVPDLVLCDVMMPGMDGPTVLARLRENEVTANTPVVFMTARTQTRELEQLKSMGAAGVITKPFDPVELPVMVRAHLPLDPRAKVEASFARRLRQDGATLSKYRVKLRANSSSFEILNALQSCVHKLAGAAGVFNFTAVSTSASILEEAVIKWRADRERLNSIETKRTVEAKLDALLECIERA